MRTPAIVFVPFGSYAVFESFLPIPVEAKNRGVSCYAILIGSGPNRIAPPGSLFDALLSHSASIHRFDAAGSSLRRVWGLLRLIGLFVLLRAKHGPLSIIYNEKQTDKPYDRWSNRFFWFFGKVRLLKQNQAILTPPFYNRLEQSKVGHDFREGMRRIKKLPSIAFADDNPIHDLYPGKQEILMFSEAEADLMEQRLDREVPHITIGLPRLYSSWKSAMQDVCSPLLKQEMAVLGIPYGSYIIVFAPTNVACTWVRDEKSNERMLDWLVDAVGHHMPESYIVVKPKPRFGEEYAKIIEKYDNPKIRLSTCPLPIWAVGASMAVVASISSAIFEFLTIGVPTIEVADYPDSFGPFGPVWPGTPGLQITNNAEEVDCAVRKILLHQCQTPDREILANYFGHRDDMFDSLLSDRVLAKIAPGQSEFR